MIASNRVRAGLSVRAGTRLRRSAVVAAVAAVLALWAGGHVVGQARGQAAPPASGAAKPMPPLSATDAAGKPKALSAVKLSAYDGAAYCDLAVAADGTFHALYTESPAIGKPVFLYHRSSPDGVTWSPPTNLSDDESGRDSGYCRAVVDGRGRVYAVWKFVPARTMLDGPGAVEPGQLVYRCLDGGAWSGATRFGSDAGPQVSWFAAVDPGGTPHVVWSEVAEDAFARRKSASRKHANLVKQAALNGPASGPVKSLITAAPLPTDAQIAAAAKRGGKSIIPYAEQYPKEVGLWNLRGHVDAGGVARFSAEQPKDAQPAPAVAPGEGAYKEGPVVYWDGAALKSVYTIDMRERDGNSFANPPTLLADAGGRPHLIRAPSSKKVERACVRDYPLNADGTPGTPVDVMTARDPKGQILGWQAWSLPGGRMAVAVTLKDIPPGGSVIDAPYDLYVSFSDGGGKWTPPLNVTDNAARATFASKQVDIATYSNLTEYFPKYGAVTAGPDGRPAVLMVNDAQRSFSFPAGVVAGGGRTIVVQGGGQVSRPAAFFLKL
jgi:hypothetical protein